MISKRSTAGLAVAALLLGLSTQAGAGHHDHRKSGPVYDYAKVVSVTPIVRYVTVKTPVKECWEDVEYYTVNNRPPNEGIRTLTGALLGGVIGHQFGGGSGNDAATAAGVVIGATVGNQSAYRKGNYGPVQYSRPVTRCETQYRKQQEKRIDGYDVVYRYHGQKYLTRMPNQPGKKIRIRVDIRPAG
ncbi:MAG: glycine zipper 2TM domain-containing protein [Woeseiaceae bacterium]